MFFRKKQLKHEAVEAIIKEVLQRQKDDFMAYKLRWIELRNGKFAVEILVYTDRYATIYKTYYAGERIKAAIREEAGFLEIFWVAIPASI
ncbi:MAG: hypothetical protein WCV63_08840 [Negativicutes bacterium]|jgi:hypothetical protein